ncbi:MAG: methyltransferase domain-containing protein [Hyphomonadaceae bacterium]|nr:methyltransferase domain-containing protein [Hyphomonadaceae bacterium]
MNANVLEEAKRYYGEVLQSSADLRTDACTTSQAPPAHVRTALERVHPDVRARYFGCGLLAPACLEGARVLDLGCGAGQDVYLLAQLVGERGAVVGVDATPRQLDVARAHQEWHRQKFGYESSNVTFLEGDIARLGDLPLAPGSFDIIVSNCVVNLVEDKAAVLAGARALLKPGGEFYFSDVYADRRVPADLRQDAVLSGECLAGALYWNDFLRLARGAGFLDPRLVSDRRLAISDEAIAARCGAVRFFSATYRLFNIAGLESACEDYGQAVRYLGGVRGAEDVFTLDGHHLIEKGRMFPVCGNTFRMLKETRFAPYFEFLGDESRHYGIFKGCGVDLPFGATEETAAAGCC